jgi:hypothetical protein
MGEIAKWITTLLSSVFGENRIGRILALLFLIIAVIAAVGIWDSMTGDFSLRQTEKKINLLITLQDLEAKGIDNSPTLKPIYEKLAKELENYGPRFLSISFDVATPNTWQLIGGLFVWVIMGLIFGLGKSLNKGNTLIGVIVLGAIGAIVGTIVPDADDVFVNILFGMGAQIVLLVLVSIYGSISNRRKRRNFSSQINEPT